jgi:hypothetical protein
LLLRALPSASLLVLISRTAALITKTAFPIRHLQLQRALKAVRMTRLRTFLLIQLEMSINVQTRRCCRPTLQKCRHGKYTSLTLNIAKRPSPLNKTQLTTGEYSLIIISNNGDGTPIAYQRDFSLTVAPQSTVTATPTVTANFTSTPIVRFL